MHHYKKTEKLRQKERMARLKRAKPFAEFELEWNRKKPLSRILSGYGTWPDASVLSSIKCFM